MSARRLSSLLAATMPVITSDDECSSRAGQPIKSTRQNSGSPSDDEFTSPAADEKRRGDAAYEPMRALINAATRPLVRRAHAVTILQKVAWRFVGHARRRWISRSSVGLSSSAVKASAAGFL